MNYREIFYNPKIIRLIKDKLPELFLLAELDNSRNGKLGMEIGSARERILIALLMLIYGKDRVDSDIPITEPETDVIVENEPISIKTMSGKKPGGVKLIWTVDPQKAMEFADNYKPACDMLFVHLNWGGQGGLYVFSKELQQDIFRKLGKEQYIKLPKPGTNPRGVEISKQAVEALVASPKANCVTIDFRRTEHEYSAYDRWLELWSEQA